MLVAVCLVVVFIAILIWLFQPIGTNQLPGPRGGFPFAGHLLQFRKLVSHVTYVHLAWIELWRQYGPVTNIKLGKDRIIVLNGFESIKSTLNMDSCDGRPDGFIWRVRTYGKRLGVIVTDGALWRRERSFVLQHFRSIGISSDETESIIREEVDALIQLINSKCIDGKQNVEMNLSNLCDISVLNILWTIMAGKRFDISDPTIHKLMGLLRDYFTSTDMSGGVLNQMPILRFIMPERSGYNLIVKTLTPLLKFLEETVKEHKKSFLKNDIRDLIDAYFVKNNVDEALNENTVESLVSILLDLCMAGIETTSNTMAFSLLRLLLAPEVQTLAQEEINRVVGRSRLPTLADRTNLPYVQAIVMEVLRISTVVATTPGHRTVEPCTVLGFKIPQNMFLIPNISSVLLDPHYWGDPEIFRPERFLDADGNILKEERFIPFGLGKRRCLGETLAMNSIFLLLASLLQNFDFKLAPGQKPPSLLPIDGLTLAPQPFTGIVTQRN